MTRSHKEPFKLQAHVHVQMHKCTHFIKKFHITTKSAGLASAKPVSKLTVL